MTAIVSTRARLDDTRSLTFTNHDWTIHESTMKSHSEQQPFLPIFRSFARTASSSSSSQCSPRPRTASSSPDRELRPPPRPQKIKNFRDTRRIVRPYVNNRTILTARTGFSAKACCPLLHLGGTVFPPRCRSGVPPIPVLSERRREMDCRSAFLFSDLMFSPRETDLRNRAASAPAPADSAATESTLPANSAPAVLFLWSATLRTALLRLLAYRGVSWPTGRPPWSPQTRDRRADRGCWELLESSVGELGAPGALRTVAWRVPADERRSRAVWTARSAADGNTTQGPALLLGKTGIGRRGSIAGSCGQDTGGNTQLMLCTLGWRDRNVVPPDSSTLLRGDTRQDTHASQHYTFQDTMRRNYVRRTCRIAADKDNHQPFADRPQQHRRVDLPRNTIRMVPDNSTSTVPCLQDTRLPRNAAKDLPLVRMIHPPPHTQDHRRSPPREEPARPPLLQNLPFHPLRNSPPPPQQRPRIDNTPPPRRPKVAATIDLLVVRPLLVAEAFQSHPVVLDFVRRFLGWQARRRCPSQSHLRGEAGAAAALDVFSWVAAGVAGVAPPG